MSALKKTEFKDAFENVVHDRSPIYSNSFALSFHWERDGTDVLGDVDAFHAILNTVSITHRSQSEVLLLSPEDMAPGWTLTQKMKSTFDAAAHARGKSLVFIHYTGHAVVEKVFASFSRGLVKEHITCITEGANGRGINLNLVIAQTVEDSHFDMGTTDVVWVLDCCYSTKQKTPSTGGRVVEIISATDGNTPGPSTTSRSSLTGKLRDELIIRQSEGHQTIEFADLMQSIRAKSQVDRPTHSLRRGVSSVRLPFCGHSVFPEFVAPCVRAVFSVRIRERMTREQLNRFDQWTRMLPQKYAITLDGVYRIKSASTILVIQGAYSVFSKLDGLPGVNLMLEVLSPNLCESRSGQ